jgi:hypothetical protein
MGISAAINQRVMSGYNYIQPKAYSLAMNLQEKRNNYDVLNKTIQVALSAIALYNSYFTAKIFTAISPSLSRVIENNFGMAILGQFRKWFFPVTAESIKIDDAIEKLETALKAEYKFNEVDDHAQFIRAVKLRPFIEKVLNEQHFAMAQSKGIASYSNVGDYAAALAQRFASYPSITVLANGHISTLPNTDPGLTTYDMSAFAAKVRTMKFTLNETSEIQNLANVNWLLVDLGTTVSLLKLWNLVDTGKMAKSLGQTKIFNKRLFNFIGTKPLEVWVRAGICTGFALNLANVANKVYNATAATSASDVRKLKIDAVANAAELIYHGTAFISEYGIRVISSRYLDALSIVARSVGLVCIALQPKPAYISQLK